VSGGGGGGGHLVNFFIPSKDARDVSRHLSTQKKMAMRKRESFCVRTQVTHSMMLIGVILVLFLACMIVFATIRWANKEMR